MKRIIKVAFFLSMMALSVPVFSQKTFELSSPDSKVQTKIVVSNTDIKYNVKHDGDLLLDFSPISMKLEDGSGYGVNPKLSGTNKRTVNETIDMAIYKKKQVHNNFNELTLRFKGDYNIIFRAYDDGVAYRFVSTTKKPFKVVAEEVKLNFIGNPEAYIPYVRDPKPTLEEQFFNSFENIYTYTQLSKWDAKRLAFLPLLVEGVNGKKVCITEADLLNYPGLYLHNSDADATLEGILAPYPKEVEQAGHNNLQGIVKSRENYIAKFESGCQFPWRVLIVSSSDMQLANNDMVARLSTPSEGDFSWVTPGKVAWDWWNDWNLYNVDFRAGVNNETYKYYIDFASKNGIEYVILDEGWSINLKADLLQVVPEIDLKGLCEYAKTKGVDLILWAGYKAFERDMENVCRHYSEMGIKGFKVDFMDRDDQVMVDFHHRTAQMGAKYKMLIDFHGSYKPTGLQHTYPNVINFEGVYGLEQMKWATGIDHVAYDVTIPFIRMVAGPVDYTQGAMRNATKGNFRPVNNEAMSQGTRCHQLAQYVIFESPLNMLCDNPKNYESEKECLEFIANVPTVWDETVAINGEVGKYVSIARRKDSVWYVGSMTNWDERTLELDLSFLGEGNFKGEVFRDGINADRSARDYKKEIITIPADRKLKVVMSPGGGFAVKIYK